MSDGGPTPTPLRTAVSSSSMVGAPTLGAAMHPVPPDVTARLRALAGPPLRALFLSAYTHSVPLLQASVASPAPILLSDMQKLQMYALYKQGSVGDRPEGDVISSSPTDVAKAEAWKRCKGLPRRDAQRGFVFLMHQVEPGWEHTATAISPAPQASE